MFNRRASAAFLKQFSYIVGVLLFFLFVYLITNSTNVFGAYKHYESSTDCLEKLMYIAKENNSADNNQLKNFGLPGDFFQRGLIDDNELVDKLSPKLKTNMAVIYEAQRIHIKMLRALIGNFKYAMLFNFAAFENKGDPAITVGELQIIKRLGLELVFHCPTNQCKENAMEKAKTLSKGYKTEELVILLHGGGNLLSYVFEDYNRKLVLDNFPDHEVLLFPQSIWYNATKLQTRLFQNVYSKHKHLTFLYRDRNSYNLGKQLFPHVKCYLMPDMAFQMGPKQRFMEPTHDILWLKRGDSESTKYEIPASTHAYDVIVADWWAWKTPKGKSQSEDPILIAANGMLFLQRGRVVITDRLHGHILCVLCGIPHVVLDPVNKKISSYMQSWTGGIENILVANSAQDALNKAVRLLQKLDDKIPMALSFPASKTQ